MSKAVYIQRGESLDYKNSSSSKIAAGDVVLIGSVLGVAGCDIEADKAGSVHVEGVYKLAKTSTHAINMGTAVYYDGTGITEASTTTVQAEGDNAETSVSNTRVGYAAADAAAEDTEILVKINA